MKVKEMIDFLKMCDPEDDVTTDNDQPTITVWSNKDNTWIEFSTDKNFLLLDGGYNLKED